MLEKLLFHRYSLMIFSEMQSVFPSIQWTRRKSICPLHKEASKRRPRKIFIKCPHFEHFPTCAAEVHCNTGNSPLSSQRCMLTTSPALEPNYVNSKPSNFVHTAIKIPPEHKKIKQLDHTFLPLAIFYSLMLRACERCFNTISA